MSETVHDALARRLHEAFDFNRNAAVKPVALLWPDADRQWTSAIERLRERMPVIELGEYAPDSGRGPAYWLRCAVAGTLTPGSSDGPMIVYLPGVSRKELRAVEGCPRELAPIAELQYRGQWFSHPGGSDWSLRAYLSNRDRGLGLDVAEDAETKRMLVEALPRLLDKPVEALVGERVDAAMLGDLLNPDAPGSVLEWLDDPDGYRKRTEPAEWKAFAQQCARTYGFDPVTDGPLIAAERLGGRSGPWELVWERFRANPRRYPNIPGRLRQAKPMELLPPSDAWPQDNDDAEDQLRKELLDLPALTSEGVRKELQRLDHDHAWRREAVWAELGSAPLATALEHLVALAHHTAVPVVGKDVEAIRAAYSERGWRADDAVVRGLAAAPAPGDRTAVAAALRPIYVPWLTDAAASLQEAVGPMANSGAYQATDTASPSAGGAIVFVDGLRLDLAHRLRDALANEHLMVSLETGLAALPTVTPTAKAAVAPLAPKALVGGPGLEPANAATGVRATTEVLRRLIAELGLQVLGATDVGDPAGTAWTEAGDIDQLGHQLGVRVVDEVDNAVGRVATRIRELLDAGWGRVEVITDHGWILLPGGLEKVELPHAATEAKKGRCARLKEGATVAAPTVPWHWDADVRIAIAPGATCFEAGKEYEHGGVSPQECIVPRLTVSARSTTAGVGVTGIQDVSWTGLRCRVKVVGAGTCVVDIRLSPGDRSSTVVRVPKEIEGADTASLIVPDDEHEGATAYVVVTGDGDSLLAQRKIVIGGGG